MYAYIAFFIVASVYVLLLTVNSFAYGDRIYPGISVAGIYVGGMTKDKAKVKLSKAVKPPQKITLAGDEQYPIGSDLAVNYDLAKTIDNAFQIGRDDNLNPIKNYKTDVPLAVNFNHDVLDNVLINIATKENTPVEDASIYMQQGQIKTTKESIGKRILLGENVEMIENGLGNQKASFKLKVKTLNPLITESDISLVRSEVQEILSRNFSLTDGSQKYSVSANDIAGFIDFGNSAAESEIAKPSINNIFPLSSVDTVIDTGFSQKRITDFAQGFAGRINQAAQNAKLDVENGKVQVVAESVDGRDVQIDKLAADIKNALENDQSEVKIPVTITKPEVSSGNLDKLGIKELVSTGWTDFSGSPSNRIHNIDVGAARFNGVLIKPGEDFSFDDTLGNVDASTGYLPELVILKDKTVPEYGGGLCQVSTTAFRAALNAGLPILERAAHAYPVGYYKPYGVDATIYLPSPDLIFKNDTPGYILIQTRILDNKLYFDFYGTKKPGSIKFAGNADGTQGVSPTVEGITPTITEQDVRGPKSFTATFYRFIYDTAGNLIKKNFWVSKYDSPDKYPH